MQLINENEIKVKDEVEIKVERVVVVIRLS